MEHHLAWLVAVDGDGLLFDVHCRCSLVVKSHSRKHFYDSLFHHCVFLFVTMLKINNPESVPRGRFG